MESSSVYLIEYIDYKCFLKKLDGYKSKISELTVSDPVKDKDCIKGFSKHSHVTISFYNKGLRIHNEKPTLQKCFSCPVYYLPPQKYYLLVDYVEKFIQKLKSAGYNPDIYCGLFSNITKGCEKYFHEDTIAS